MAKFTHQQADGAAQLDQSLETLRTAALRDGGRPWQLDINEVDGVLTLSATVGPKDPPPQPVTEEAQPQAKKK